MPYIRINEEWSMPVKSEHHFRLDVREGLFNDTLRLYVDDELIATGKINIFDLKGKTPFMVDGRMFELRWVWSWWTGNPLSIVVMRNGRMLAMYGCEVAANDSEFRD